MATWPPFVDDDGTGTTGTVLDKTYFDQHKAYIDGLAAAGLTITYGPWTPVDGSGVGLVFNVLAAIYARLDRVVFIWGQIVYPGNANGAAAKIGGLPFMNSTVISGFYQTYGVTQSLHLAGGQNVIQIIHPTSLAARTNADLSGVNLIFAGIYYTG